MMRMDGIAEDDKLDAEQRKRVLRRAIGMAKPFRRTIIGALACVAISTTGMLLGAVIVRYGIDSGISKFDRTALRNSVFGYVVVVAVAYLASRQQ